MCVCVCVCVPLHYFRLHDAVHNDLQCFQFVALHDPFKVLGSVSESLGDRHVQVVVGLLCCQVLFTHITLRFLLLLYTVNAALIMTVM